MKLFLAFVVCFTNYHVVLASDPKLNVLRSGTPNLIFEGETVNVSCTVTNAQEVPDIVWLLDFKRIRSNENQLIDTKKSGTNASSILTLRTVTSGQYNKKIIYCKDTENDESSLPKKLTIGTIRVSSSGGDFPKYGDDVILTCSLTEGVAGDVGYLLWREIPSKRILKKADNETSLQLQLKQVTETEAGIYECVCNTRTGYSFFINKTTEIKAVSPANTGKKQKEVLFKIGQMVNLTCDVRGYPLNILWKKNCASISSESDIDNKHTLANSNRTLVIMETDSQTQGMYCCIGSNEGGRAKQMFILNRAISPSNPGKEKKEISFKIGQMVNLTCDVRGYPLNILWKKNCLSNCSENIFNNHTMVNSNRTLIITETNSQTQGTYCCIGWNDDGRAVQVFILKPDGRYTNDGIRLKSGLSSLILLVVFNHVFK